MLPTLSGLTNTSSDAWFVNMPLDSSNCGEKMLGECINACIRKNYIAITCLAYCVCNTAAERTPSWGESGTLWAIGSVTSCNFENERFRTTICCSWALQVSENNEKAGIWNSQQRRDKVQWDTGIITIDPGSCIGLEKPRMANQTRKSTDQVGGMFNAKDWPQRTLAFESRSSMERMGGGNEEKSGSIPQIRS